MRMLGLFVDRDYAPMRNFAHHVFKLNRGVDDVEVVA